MAEAQAKKRERRTLGSYTTTYAVLASIGIALSYVGIKDNIKELVIIGAPCALWGLVYVAALSRTIGFLFAVGGAALWWASMEYQAFGGWNTAFFGVGLVFFLIGFLGLFFRNIAEG